MDFDTQSCDTTTFNNIVQFNTTCQWDKLTKESTAPLAYRFDIGPTSTCFNPCRSFSGLSVTASKRPPDSLLDVENFLRTSGLIVEEEKGCIDDIHAASPSMPSILDNKIIIPDCVEDNCFTTTKVWKSGNPNYSKPMSDLDRQCRGQSFQTNVGRDTRREVRDAYKDWRTSTRQPNSYVIPNNTTNNYPIPNAYPIQTIQDPNTPGKPIQNILGPKKPYNQTYNEQLFPCQNKSCVPTSNYNDYFSNSGSSPRASNTPKQSPGRYRPMSASYSESTASVGSSLSSGLCG
jgi:hypothetical protein